ncbi:GNAT family N-acetyltransferase [Thalassolituus hydrocarboniclasticus]|uniref:GNAT family N-acetyltransferase n=1 Tax=Thalassolituus hydrocarboniclasticus TaxID=2742796 RepID=A0ABY6ADX1_9GAMM|nr:GNAT family N-acetyltransferase [Thalassolituus hydrocarboniclasticus]UXD88481.1 GNAT family N-acetyltransferase [Thalassolituus hydrocarboniclasticus]
MRDLSFRPCVANDVSTAVPLIYSSGPGAFDYVFCSRHAREAQDFLQQAFINGRSEFGFQQHLAAVLDGEVVGVGALRTQPESAGFMLAALRDIGSFYAAAQIPGVIYRGLRTERVIRPPQANRGLIYQLGVKPQMRGRGIGEQLVQQLILRAQTLALTHVALDVADNNPRARALYLRLGFKPRVIRHGGFQSAFGGVGSHEYMEKPIG